MILLDSPSLQSNLLALRFRHVQIVGSPVLHVVKVMNDPKDLDKAIALKMHDPTPFVDGNIGNRYIARPVGIDQSVGFELCQPFPTQGSDLLEVLQTAVPTIEADITGTKTATPCTLKHLLEEIG